MSAIQSIQELLKGLSVEDLLVVIAAATAEAKKAVKVEAKVSKAPKEKKGSMPKGVTPPQLHKPRAWVDFVLSHANANGWPAIAVKGQEEPLPASVERDGAHVFESTGKPMNNKQAMSLSKQYWDRKAAMGSHQALYEEFDAAYVVPIAVPAAAPAAPAVVETVVAAAQTAVVEPKKPRATKTEAEKLAAKEAKKAKQESTVVEAPVAAVAASTVAAVAASTVAAVAASTVAAVASAKATPKKKAAKAEVDKDTFTCADDGQVHPWDWKGKKFLRNTANQVWARSDDNEAGEWQGVFDPQTMKIDDSVEEPDFEDE